jgi:glucosyl-3-phosphoglycerate synthase
MSSRGSFPDFARKGVRPSGAGKRASSQRVPSKEAAMSHGSDERTAGGARQALRWCERRTFHHSAFHPERVLARGEVTVSVCLPARNEAATIGRNVGALRPLLERGVVDQLVVVDDSSDGTGEIAARRGAEVYEQSSLCPEFGPVAGKGDAMWRALTVLRGDVVCFLDADSEDLGPHFACGLAGPVVLGEAWLAKGFYRRPLRIGNQRLPEGGGRVSELMARPLLNAFYPALAGFFQPLAGEFAARRELLERLPFATGYGVEIGMLIDAWRAVGLEGLAQVDLDVRQNRHRPLHELAPMASAVLGAVTARLVREGRLAPAAERGFLLPFEGALVPQAIEYAERPPLATLRTSVG